MKKICLLISVSILMLSSAGCGPNGSHDITKTKLYSIDIETEQQAQQTYDYKLKVLNFRISEEFDLRNFIILREKNRYIKEYYNKFMINPSSMLTKETRNWFANRGYFQAVLTEGTIVDADYILEGNVISIYGDFRDLKKPEAVIEVQFQLVETTGSNNLILSKIYSDREELDDNTSEELIEAYERAFENILQRLADDIASQLKKRN